MNKKITVALLAGVATGIAIYFVDKVVNEKKSAKQNDKDRSAGPKRSYAYEYTL